MIKRGELLVSSLLDLVNGGESLLHGAGVDLPRLDSELMLAHVLGESKTYVLTHFNDEVSKDVAHVYESLVKRRSLREPLAYITGEKEFYSLNFKVTKATLIPRPETETLVDAAFDIYGPETSISVLDIGTGSGAIAVALAADRPLWRVTAVDLSEPALEIAKENVSTHGLDERITLKKSDLFASVEGESFDLIISNPPYIPQGDQSLAPEIKLFEPCEALYSGANGLDAIERLILESFGYLNDEGVLIFEMGDGQSEKVEDMINDSGLYNIKLVAKDLGGMDRAIIAKKKG